MAISFIKRFFGGSTQEECKDGICNVEEPRNTEESSCCSSDTLEESPSESVSRLEDFVLYVVQSLVDEPEEVKLNTVEKNNTFVIQVSCVKKDTGKIIGKSGKTISAIRSLVSGTAGRVGLRATVDVLD